MPIHIVGIRTVGIIERCWITKAVEELESGGKLVSPGQGRVRRIGGGRKKVEGVDPGVRDLVW